MSQYTHLDSLILSSPGLQGRVAGPSHLSKIDKGEVHAEAERLREATGREAFRILDGRLQALRKAGEITFDSKNGWARVTAREAHEGHPAGAC